MRANEKKVPVEFQSGLGVHPVFYIHYMLFNWSALPTLWALTEKPTHLVPHKGKAGSMSPIIKRHGETEYFDIAVSAGPTVLAPGDEADQTWV
jgi:hypothetical protein